MKTKSFISKLLVASLSMSILFTSLGKEIASADSYKVVTLGANLSQSQKDEMLKYFDVTKNDANILEITSEEEYKYLGNVATSAQLGNKSISCSYVEPTTTGGLVVKTNNLTWVTDGMIKNALITAGIENAVVSASAPFKVSGTAALTGILKGFENSSAGEKIDEDKKEAANEELVVTGDLGEKIGQDDATNLINDVKKDVIKKKPSTDKEMDKIIDKATKNYESELSDADKENIKNVMSKINDLDLNYNNLKDQLNGVTEQLKDKIDTDKAKGFFAKIGDFFSNLWNSFLSLFDNDDSTEQNTDSKSSEENNTSKSEETNTSNNDNTTNNNSSKDTSVKAEDNTSTSSNEDKNTSSNNSSENVDTSNSTTNSTDDTSVSKETK